MPSAAANFGIAQSGSGFDPATFSPFVWMDTRFGITDDGSSRVNPWVDHSSNAYSFSQSTANNRFGYTAVNASFNNKPTANPNGANDNYLKSSGITAFGTTFSYFEYSLVNTAQSGTDMGAFLWSGGTSQIVFQNIAAVATMAFSNNVTSDSLLTLSDTINQKRSLCLTYNGSTGAAILYRKQGNNATTSATRTITAGARPANQFDRILWGNTAGSLVRTVCEMIGVPSVLTQANFEAFHAWAVDLYGS